MRKHRHGSAIVRKDQDGTEQPQGATARQMEHNRVLTGLKGMKVESCELITLTGGTLPNGRAYDGAAFRIDCKDRAGHDVRLVLTPLQADNLEFFLFRHEGNSAWSEESPADRALHACDYLEDQCTRQGSDLSRFRGERTTVYIALAPKTRQAMDAVYDFLKLQDAAVDAYGPQ